MNSVDPQDAFEIGADARHQKYADMLKARGWTDLGHWTWQKEGGRAVSFNKAVESEPDIPAYDPEAYDTDYWACAAEGLSHMAVREDNPAQALVWATLASAAATMYHSTQTGRVADSLYRIADRLEDR